MSYIYRMILRQHLTAVYKIVQKQLFEELHSNYYVQLEISTYKRFAIYYLADLKLPIGGFAKGIPRNKREFLFTIPWNIGNATYYEIPGFVHILWRQYSHHTQLVCRRE
jgi:hypothetical protein